MAFPSEQNTTSDTKDSVFLKFQPINRVGEYSEVKFRVLAGDPKNPDEPADVWTHWHENRSYNCARPLGPCPVCVKREQARLEDPIGYRNTYQLSHQFFFNVLVTEDGYSKVKVYAFGNGVAKRLQAFAQRYGDLRGYDITVRKTKTGSQAKNVEYEPFYDGPRNLTSAEQEASSGLHDLSQYTKGAPVEVLTEIANGRTPGENTLNPGADSKTQVDLLLDNIKEAAEKKGLELHHFGIDVNTPVSQLETLLRDLQV